MPPVVKDVTIRFTGDDKDLKRANTTLDSVNQKVNTVAASTVQASQKIKTANQQTAQSFGNMQTSLSGLAAQIGITFSVGAIIQFGKSAIESFKQAEESARKLSFAVRNIANGTTGDVDILLKQSKELQKVGIFSDEQIQSAQTALLTLGLTVDEVQKLTPAISDAAAASGDFDGTLQKVIGGINGQNRGMKQLGVYLSDTKDKGERVSEITDKLSKQFGGSMADALETAAGKAANLNHRFDEMLEVIGENIIDKIDILKATLFDLGDAFATAFDPNATLAQQKTALEDLGTALLDVVTFGLSPLETSTARAITTQKEFNKELKALQTGSTLDYIQSLKVLYTQLAAAITLGTISQDEFAQKTEMIFKELKRIEKENANKGKGKKGGLTDEEIDAINKAAQETADLKKEQLRMIRDLEIASMEEGWEKERELLKEKFARDLEDVKGHTETANQLRLQLEVNFQKDLADLEQKEKERKAEERDKESEDLIKKREKDLEDQEKFDKDRLDQIENYNQEIISINQETAAILKEIEDIKLDAFSQGFGALAQLFEGNAELQSKILAFEKLAAIVELVVNLQREKAANAYAAAAASAINPTAAAAYALRATAQNQLANARAGIAIGTIAAQALPQLLLAKGAVQIDGPGTETSDSIPARLSKGETVTSAEKTRKHKGLLLALHDEKLESYINEKYVMPALNMALGHRWLGAGNGSNNSKGFEGIDYKKMGKSMPKSVSVDNIGELAKAMNKEARKSAMFKRRGVSN